MSPAALTTSTDDVGVLGSVDLLLLVQRMVSRTAVPTPRDHDAPDQAADGH